MYDNHSENDDMSFLYDDTPQEMNESRNLYYDSHNQNNDDHNTNNDNLDVNNDIHYMYDENHDMFDDVGYLQIFLENNGPNRHDDRGWG